MLAGLLPLAMAGDSLAQVYKWTDADGRVHYGPQAPPGTKASTLAVQQSRSANPESNVQVPDSAIQYYQVYGTTPLALHMSMAQNGPFNEIVQKRVYAEIAWRYEPKFDYVNEPGKCRLSKFTIVLVTTITMPKWMDEANAPAETLALWPAVVSKIRQHEDGHKAIGIEGANVLARRLKSLGSYENCRELNRIIRSEHERIYGEYSLANRAFDRTEALRGSPFKDER